ncbi:MAG: hypothetical protein EXR52_06370 [Dehalococcoidia bacterium]|nr:hypothetical protein [Dehalococcoidia bacterium]
MAKYVTESGKKVVTLIPGDGIGTEVTAAAQRLVQAAGVAIQWDHQVAGGDAFRTGVHSGVPVATLDSIRRSRVVLKGPLETPVGFGDKSERGSRAGRARMIVRALAAHLRGRAGGEVPR